MPEPVLPEAVAARLARARASIQALGRATVAFSGGVDSTVLVRLARDVLGRERVTAVTARSASLASEDLAEAVRLAREMDVRHELVDTGELDDPRYRANQGDRCYVCKRELFDVLARRFAGPILYGAIGDDRASERPGQRAAAERGVRAPLQEAGLAKEEIRLIARAWGLSNWDRPQNACLASRLPQGLTVTPERLRQVEDAERWLRTEGFRQVRVRLTGAGARIEVGRDEVVRLAEPGLRDRVLSALYPLGFTEVTIDPAGYRPGGANQEHVSA